MANGMPLVLGQSNTATNATTVTGGTTAVPSLSVQKLTGTSLVAASIAGTAIEVGTLGGPTINANSFSNLGVLSRCIDTRDRPGISMAVMGTVAGGFGVAGSNDRGAFPEAGVTGRARTAQGVEGISVRGLGVRGMTQSARTTGAGVLAIGSPGHALVAIANQTATAPGITPAGPLFAGLLFGNVQVQGDVTVFGAKSAAVPHPDGTRRRLYCVESPEEWFEDFGAADLVGGRATVAFEKTFAPLVVRKDYHVFLTPEGDCRGLYVRRKTQGGFEVRELQNGKGTLRFSYRVVLRRRDSNGKRLEKIEPGTLPRQAAAEIALPEPRRQKGEVKSAAALVMIARRAAGRKRVRK
jgi:hypothetical protein